MVDTGMMVATDGACERTQTTVQPETVDSLPVPQPTQSKLQLTVRNCTV